MPATIERAAPSSPDHRPSDEELHRIVYGDQAAEDDIDEIVYKHPRGTFFTSRAERERAQRIWEEEGQVPYPNNAEANLARTEAMLRLRLNAMGPAEFPDAARDRVALTNHRVQEIEEQRLAREAAETEAAGKTPDWATDSTGNFVQENPTPPTTAPEAREYTGRHRSRRMRVPLTHLLRRRHSARHAA